MATMNISLPDKMREWIEERVASGSYANASDYMRDLVRQDEQRAQAAATFERVVEDAYASGISTRTRKELREWVKQRAEAAVGDDVAAVKRRRARS